VFRSNVVHHEWSDALTGQTASCFPRHSPLASLSGAGFQHLKGSKVADAGNTTTAWPISPSGSPSPHRRTYMVGQRQAMGPPPLPADKRLVNTRVLGIVLGLVAIGGSLFAMWVAVVWHWVACCSESGLEASAASEYQIGIAAFGLIPAVGTVVSGLLWPRLGSPWYWFGATAMVYVAWLAYAVASFSSGAFFGVAIPLDL
jgi:hypothetical protein